MYVRALAAGDAYFEREDLTEKDRYNEYVMTRLRTKWGCALPEMRKLFAAETVAYFLKAISGKMDLVNENEGVYTLNMAGRLCADGIASGLFLV
jgi:oxygen-independent coproporphyrinogen-3 oxidase